MDPSVPHQLAVTDAFNETHSAVRAHFMIRLPPRIPPGFDWEAVEGSQLDEARKVHA